MTTRPDFSSFPSAALVHAYNTCAAELERPVVNKFSDKPTAVKRLNAILDDIEAAGLAVSYLPNGAIEGIVRKDSISPTPSEVQVVEDAQEGTLGTGWDHEDGQRLLAKTEDLVTEAVAPASVGGLTTLELTHRIEVLVENPKRKGSRARTVFDLYRTGMTGEEFVVAVIAAGMDRRVALSNLHWDIDHGFIYLGADAGQPRK